MLFYIGYGVNIITTAFNFSKDDKKGGMVYESSIYFNTARNTLYSIR